MDPFIYRFSDIDVTQEAALRGPNTYFTLFDFSAKNDPVPTARPFSLTRYARICNCCQAVFMPPAGAPSLRRRPSRRPRSETPRARRRKPAMAAHGDEAMRLFRDPGFRAAVKHELTQPARRMFNGEWDKLFVAQCQTLLREIAKRIGVSQPALYHYFASKEALVDENGACGAPGATCHYGLYCAETSMTCERSASSQTMPPLPFW